MKARWFLGFLATVALTAASCATDVGTIDRTQNDKLEKKLFGGIWYKTDTVIDIPYNAAFSFVGEMNFGSTGKVMFDVGEKFLVVYPVTEYVQDSEKAWHSEKFFKYWDDNCLNKGSANHECLDGIDNLGRTDMLCCYVKQYVGQPIAAYEITSQFDVTRKYNAQTGEETNVIEENSSDKFWWQRTHMRVNWANNNVRDFTFLASKVAQTAVDYYVEAYDTTNPDAPTLTPDYIDVVTKTYGEPMSAGSCDIYGVAVGDCAPAVVKFRTAYRKTDVREDYEPLQYSNTSEMPQFGFFNTTRQTYDENWGFTESGKVSFANRWNLWQHSFDEVDLPWLDKSGKPVVDSNGVAMNKPCFKDTKDTGCDTANNDGAKEFCKADDWFTQGHCVVRTTKAYTQRGLAPILYHVSFNLPLGPTTAQPNALNIWSGSVRTAEVWSDALKDSVAWLYFWEEKTAAGGQMGIAGSYASRTCTTDADCAPDAIADTWIDISSNVDGSSAKKPPAKTLVVTGTDKAGVAVLDWGYPAGLASAAGIRLINLSGTDGISLVTDSGTVLSADVVALTGSSDDPATPQTDAVPAFSGKKLSVQGSDGTVLATTVDPVSAANNTVTTVVYANGQLVSSTFNKSAISGLRVINATDKVIDVALDGALRASGIQPGENSGYQPFGGMATDGNLPGAYVPQRVVAMLSGTHGDVTCYRLGQISKCVGYRPQIGDADFDRYEQIKAALPAMFTMCHNQYTPASGTVKNDDVYKSQLYAPWTEVKKFLDQGYKVVDGMLMLNNQAADLPVVNPCLDFQYGAEKLTADQRLAEFGKMKKVGDTRYTMIYWVPEAELVSPLGYGPAAADPDTGQVFYAAANIYGAPLMTYGALTRDVFDLVNGNIATADYVTGQTIKDKVLGHGTNIATSNLVAQASPVLPNLQVSSMANSLKAAKPVSWLEMRRAIREANLQLKTVYNLPTVSPTFGKDRLSMFKGTPYEALLVSDEVKMAMSAGGLSATDALTADSVAALSPLNYLNLGDLQTKERNRQMVLSKHNYCFASFNDDGVIGVAQSWGCLPDDPRKVCGPEFDPLNHTFDVADPDRGCIKDGDKLARAIVERFYTAVVEHEVGHTLGLRHNFTASTDVFNFDDEYYDIRVKEHVPCNEDGECDTYLGQFCKADPTSTTTGKSCAVNAPATCTKSTDCGLDSGQFECTAGQCIKIQRCTMNGQCPSGSFCGGDTGFCYTRTPDGKVRVDSPVVAGGDGFLNFFVPRGELKASEIAQSRTAHQYSSIMDYGQRWNSDSLDIGKYDKAAMRFGYGKMVDTYQDLSHLHGTLRTYAASFKWTPAWTESIFGILMSGGWNDGVGFSELQYLQNYIGVEANRSEGAYKRNRVPMPIEWVDLENSMVSNYYRSDVDKTYYQVPYKFMGDEYNGNMGTYTWDTGIDPLEIVYNMGIQVNDYYLLDAFKRQRFGFALDGNPLSYISRIQSRYMEPMRGAGMLYALYGNILRNYQTWRGTWANSALLGMPLRRASELGFELLANSFSSPAPGSFKLDPATGVMKNISFSEVPGADVTVPLGQGKYPYTTFMNDAGYFYWHNALYVGAFWEKLAALMTLTDSTVYFTTNYVGEQLNIGVGTSIGFNTMYPRQLTELLGGIVAGDQDKYAWTFDPATKAVGPKVYVDPANKSAYDISPPPYVTAATPVAGARPIEASIDNLTLKDYAMLYGLAFLPASFDPSFLDSFALCLEGNGNCYDVNPESGIQKQYFADPFGGKTYVGWAPNYQTGWYAPNVSLIAQGKALLAKWNVATGDEKAALELDLKKVVETLDLMRGIYEVFSNMKI